MTIKEYTDDYIENYGVKMIALARVTGEQTALLNLHYSMGATLSFLLVASQMPCLLIKHKSLFRQFFGKVHDLDEEVLHDWYANEDEWFNNPVRFMAELKDRMLTNIEVLYAGR